MKTIACIAAVALVAVAPVAAPASAAPAPSVSTPTVSTPTAHAPASVVRATPRALVRQDFAVIGKFTSSVTAEYGDARGIGNLRVARGTVNDLLGKRAGTLTAVSRVVAPGSKQDSEMRDTQVQVQLKGGQIFAQAVYEDPRNGNPKDYQVYPVTGGTGAYASARGTLALWPQGGTYRLGYDIFVEKNLKATSFTVDVMGEAAYDGDGPQGVGNVAMLRGIGADDSYVLVATTIGTRIETVDIQVSTAEGSLFGRSIARSTSRNLQPMTFAVLGGTGSFAGYRGDLKLSANALSITARLAAPAGSGKRVTWFEDGGRRPVTVEIPGGTFLGVRGSMFKAAGDRKKSGEYFASRISYQPVGGISPVMTMLEQDFASATVIVSGITLSTGEDGTPVSRPIIGGTGDYGGAAGQVSSTQESSTLWRKSGRIWR